MNQPRLPDRSSDDDIDARFAAIVAGWDDEAQGPDTNVVPPASVTETPSERRPLSAPEVTAAGTQSLPPERSSAGSGAFSAPSAESTPPTPSCAPPHEEMGTSSPGGPVRRTFDVAPTGWRVHVPTEDADDGFVAPDPALPRGDLRFWGSVVGLVLGPLLLVVWTLTSPHSTNLPLLLGTLATVAGFALLISQLPQAHDEDDDGARV